MSKDITTDMALVLETEHGRRVIKHLLDTSGVDAVCFTGDYGQDCYDRGQQAMGQKIKNLAWQADHERLIQMWRESL